MPTPMPTAAKGVAALAFGVVGWLMADAYIPNMPYPEQTGYFHWFVAALGVIVGWRVMGNAVGKGYLVAVGSGWKTIIVLVIFALLLFGIYEMLMQSVRMMYDTPTEAILDVFRQMAERSQPLLSVSVIAVAAIGGGLAGILTENVSRRWR